MFVRVLLSAALCGIATPAFADIDFETIPGTVPSSGLAIGDQFVATDGVSFMLENGDLPLLAQVGAPETGFQGVGGGADEPLAGQDIGEFFLTDDGRNAGLSSIPLIVSYDPPSSMASGVILDMDADETFTIEARDANDVVLETVTIQAGDPNTGNGVATPWLFNRASTDIHSIRFVGTRTANGSFGLGFDRFSARSLESAFFISPPSGTYVTSQSFDVTLVTLTGLPAVGLTGTLDGNNISGPLWACVNRRRGMLDAPLNGETLRCPGIAGTVIGAGSHTLQVELELQNGLVLTQQVQWEILANTE